MSLPIFPGGPVTGMQHMIPQEGVNVNNGKVTITPMLPPAAVPGHHQPQHGMPVGGGYHHPGYGYPAGAPIPGPSSVVGGPPGYHAMAPPQTMPGVATIQQRITLR